MAIFPEELLVAGSKKIGISLGQDELKLYSRYYELLEEWNEKFNLTAIKEPDEIVIKHFLDSISLLPYLEKKSNLKLLDIGTGAGFPGVPLKIAYQELDVVLLDSLNKRVKFLEEIILELGLNGIKAIHGRAEDYARLQEYRESFDIVVSRAVAKISVLAEICLPFVKQEGSFIAYKGPKLTDELAEGQSAIKILGGQVYREEQISLPGNEEVRKLIFIKKVSPSPDKYPRKAGIPEKRPL